MHWVERDGVRLPKRIGGHPALDFCNTWAGWGEPPEPRREWLKDYDTFAVWAGYAGLVDDPTVSRLRRRARRQAGEADAALADARRLRALLHRAVLEPTDRRALAGVTGYLRRSSAVEKLAAAPDGTVSRRLGLQAGLALPTLAVARAGADLLVSADLGLVSACPGHDCGWLFLDRTRRRRWCSMSACGNRAKVAAHARRQKSRN